MVLNGKYHSYHSYFSSIKPNIFKIRNLFLAISTISFENWFQNNIPTYKFNGAYDLNSFLWRFYVPNLIPDKFDHL